MLYFVYSDNENNITVSMQEPINYETILEMDLLDQQEADQLENILNIVVVSIMKQTLERAQRRHSPPNPSQLN